MRAFACAAALAALLHFAGLLLFNEGFFLTRVELADKSACGDVPRDHGDDDDNAAGAGGAGPGGGRAGACWTRPRFRRAVVLVIDALRYDFAAWDPAAARGAQQPRPFENKMAAIRDLLMLRPAHALLVPFYADPPTTTMQRLKGVVTGGLPTFMEIKDDVASEGIEITEDNFIDLLINDGTRNITFMGDDTWTVLFPNQFNRAYPYPSFNVKDLHTVDEGVLEHLIPEMRRDDWSFLVGHFLGVDHCGHRYGPDNDHMTKKLLQMNQAIDDVVRTMDEGGFEDTVLLIFGDHGMTEDGNHGGATEEEVGAALFVYSPSPLLLGGTHADDAAAALREDLMRELALLHENEQANARDEKAEIPWQLKRRPSVQQIDLAPTLGLLLGLPIPFGNLGAIVPELFFVGESWVDRYRALNEAIEVNVGQVLRYLAAYGERAGAQQGVGHETLTALRRDSREAFQRLRAAEKGAERLGPDGLLKAHRETYAAAQDVLQRASAAGRSLWTQFNLAYMGLGFALALAGLLVLVAALRLPFAREVLRENSWADCIVCVGAVVLQMLSRLSNSYIVSEPRGVVFISVSLAAHLCMNMLRAGRFKAALGAAAVCVCSRLAVELGEAQWWRGQEAVPGDLALPWFWALCVIPSIMVLAALQAWLWRQGHTSPLFALVVGVQGVATLAHWTLQAMGIFVNGRLWLPRLVYGLGVPVAIAGLVTGPMGSIAPYLASLLFPYLLIVGPVSPSACALFLVHVGALAYVKSERDTKSDAVVAVLWSMASMTYFFATGHESFFNKLHYASPFVGFDEYEYFRGGLMMGSNTFGVYMVLVWLVAFLAPSAQERAFYLLVLCLVQACRSIVMTAFVAAERRHLMVWAIFAPKYVFDGVTLLVIDASLVLFVAKAVSKRAAPTS